MISAGLNVLVAILSRHSKMQSVGPWKVGDVLKSIDCCYSLGPRDLGYLGNLEMPRHVNRCSISR
jgi:hypothetical protein